MKKVIAFSRTLYFIGVTGLAIYIDLTTDFLLLALVVWGYLISFLCDK
jgi:hypothetical protein